jgi:hypothetical protein
MTYYCTATITMAVEAGSDTEAADIFLKERTSWEVHDVCMEVDSIAGETGKSGRLGYKGKKQEIN